MKKTAVRWILAICSIVLAVCGLLVLMLSLWVIRTWAHLSADEFIFQITNPIEGTAGDMVMKAVKFCLPPLIIMPIVSAVILKLTALTEKKSFWIFPVIHIVLAITLTIIGILLLWNHLDMSTYVSSKTETSDFIENNYVDPKNVQITFPEKKRNLVFIFLESMEITFADPANGGAFEQSRIPELTELEKEGEDFGSSDGTLDGGYVMPGTSWTVGGMFAQTSGLPILLGQTNNNDMLHQASFFPEIKTLGDILSEEGYRQVLLLGSPAYFAGRELYFTEHGGYEQRDYNYAINAGWIDPDYNVNWGYEDEKLYQFAKENLAELAAGDQPFNLTFLTTDTHFEDGYPCRLCPDTFDDQYSNAYACSSKQTTEFIKWLQQQDFYENTTVILAGDHCTMDKDFCDGVPEDYDRRTYVCVLNAPVEYQSSENERVYTTMDIFPTTLAAMGCTIDGDRLGLGTNLYSSEQTLTEQYGVDYVNNELLKGSDFVKKLAALDYYNESWQRDEGLFPSMYLSVDDNDNGVLDVRISQANKEPYEKLESARLIIKDNDGNVLYDADMKKDGKSEYTASVDTTTFPEWVVVTAEGSGESGTVYHDCLTIPAVYPQAVPITTHLPLMNNLDFGGYMKLVRQEAALKDLDILIGCRGDGAKDMLSEAKGEWKKLGLDTGASKAGSRYCAMINGDGVTEVMDEETNEIHMADATGTDWCMQVTSDGVNLLRNGEVNAGNGGFVILILNRTTGEILDMKSADSFLAEP